MKSEHISEKIFHEGVSETINAETMKKLRDNIRALEENEGLPDSEEYEVALERAVFDLKFSLSVTLGKLRGGDIGSVDNIKKEDLQELFENAYKLEELLKKLLL